MLSKQKAMEWVLGTLPAPERAEIARARMSDAQLDAEIAELEAQFAPLTAAAGEVAPPGALLDRIVGAIGGYADELGDKTALTASEGEWLPYKMGIEARRMWNRTTVMLRCRPGAVLPAHEHPADEHIIVISGDFVVGGRSFGPGDYHHSPRGSAHADAFTRGGCLLLVQYAT